MNEFILWAGVSSLSSNKMREDSYFHEKDKIGRENKVEGKRDEFHAPYFQLLYILILIAGFSLLILCG